MWTESEIQNFKNIFLDETCGYAPPDEAEKRFDETFEKIRNLDFQDKEKAIHKLSEILETPAEVLEFLNRNLDNVKSTSPEEIFRNIMCLGREFWRIEEKQH